MKKAKEDKAAPGQSGETKEVEGDFSRRDALIGLATAGAALVASAPNPSAQASARSPSLLGGNLMFRGFVRYGSTAAVVPLRLLPGIPGLRQILIKTQAVQACYSMTGQVLGTNRIEQATVPGHGGVGVVVAVGEGVRRFKVGDRAIVCITCQCGVCYHCLNGRADLCDFISSDGITGAFPTPNWAEMEDGTKVNSDPGGFAEYMVCYEEWATPIFSNASALHLSLLSCVGSTGLGPPIIFTPVKPGTDVVVFGLGPIGLSMVNGAAIMGAGQIIGVDPITYRREVAMQLGATAVVDPTGKDETLVAELRDMCKGPTSRLFAGGRTQVAGRRSQSPYAFGPDFVFEATGGQHFVPKVEPQPDPNGILPLQQAWELATSYGHLTTTGVGQTGNVSFPAGRWSNGGKTIHAANYGGTNVMRDVPHYVKLLERGLYKADKIATGVYKLDQAREAVEAAAYRTTVSAHVVYE